MNLSVLEKRKTTAKQLLLLFGIGFIILFILDTNDDRVVDSVLKKHLENYESIEGQFPETKQFVELLKNNELMWTERILKDREKKRNKHKRLFLGTWVGAMLSGIFLFVTCLKLQKLGSNKT